MSDMNKFSLDDTDRLSFGAARNLSEAAGSEIVLQPLDLRLPDSAHHAEELSLCGTWEFARDGNASARLGTPWKDKFTGHVPCSIHKALFDAGLLPDPTVGRNQILAREESFHTWWLRCRFRFSADNDSRWHLCFDGVADRCIIWLNGKEIARHQGMFGIPEIDVTELLEPDNELTVMLEPIPFEAMEENNAANNASWRRSVVINNVYGWHYSNLPSLGIWQPVRLRPLAAIELHDPFIFTRDAAAGRMALCVPISATAPATETLRLGIRPLNLDGQALSCDIPVKLDAGHGELRYEFTIPHARLWWPNDLGEQNLYEMTVAVGTSVYRHQFGIRTIEMAPLPGGVDANLYNWQFVINGRHIFVSGTGWCTADALLDLTRERYERFLSLARDQHIRMMRAWGCGLPETDDFYDLCDRVGIMIMQEWPTAWDSHNDQPMDILKETVERHTIRLRNYPSLVMYGAGNESPNPFGEAIDMMGRAAIELDGTRPYHRGEPWGGSKHDYGTWWGNEHIDHHLSAVAPFWGEFGLASVPSVESVNRYLPEESRELWPPENNPDFVYHTPVFGYANDLARLKRCAEYFLPQDYDLKQFVAASQFAQALAVRRVLERSRTRYPECTGVLYYKLNDNFPAVSWSSVDWYGAPKIAHYVFQDSFEPLHACVLFDHCGFEGQAVELPVYALDDNNELAAVRHCEVTVRAFDAGLHLIREQRYTPQPDGSAPMRLGSFCLSCEETVSAPLFVVCDIVADQSPRSRTFYFSNFESTRGGLFRLPQTTLTLFVTDNRVTIRNTGAKPAVGVMLAIPGHNHYVSFSDNFLWIDPGQELTVLVSGADETTMTLLAISCLNMVEE